MRYPKGNITKALNRKDENAAILWVENKNTGEGDTINYALIEGRSSYLKCVCVGGDLADTHNDLKALWEDPENFLISVWDDVAGININNQN